MAQYVILAVGLGGVALLILTLARAPLGSGQREFQWDGETYFWVPDQSPRPLFAKWYEFGSFEYQDGTPVTDLTTVRVLNEEWIRMWRRGEADVG